MPSCIELLLVLACLHALTTLMSSVDLDCLTDFSASVPSAVSIELAPMLRDTNLVFNPSVLLSNALAAFALNLVSGHFPCLHTVHSGDISWLVCCLDAAFAKGCSRWQIGKGRAGAAGILLQSALHTKGWAWLVAVTTSSALLSLLLPFLYYHCNQAVPKKFRDL